MTLASTQMLGLILAVISLHHNFLEVVCECCEQRVCHARADPRMLTFDGRNWDFHIPGTYIMYRHNSLPLEVQAKFDWCRGRRGTCVCGVAIRSGNSVFVVQYCSGYSMTTYGSNTGTMIIEQQWPSVWYFRVTLATGTVVTFSPNDVHILSSLSDYNNVRGLCGNDNFDCTDDFMLRGNTMSSVPGVTQCSYSAFVDDFGTSWSVQTGEDLFMNEFDPNIVFPMAIMYCACLAAGVGSPSDAIAQLYECQTIINDITNDVFRKKQTGPAVDAVGRKRRSASDGDNIVLACGDCKECIANDEVVKLCLEAGVLTYEMVKVAIQNCLKDVKATEGSNHYTPTYVASLQKLCLELANKSQREELSSVTICPGACNLQGRCVEGECECKNGYAKGGDCGLTLTLTDGTDGTELTDGTGTDKWMKNIERNIDG